MTNQQTGTRQGVGTGSNTYELRDITFTKSGNNKIHIQVPPGQTTVEFSLGEWNQVLMGLGLDQYLQDPESFSNKKS